MDAGDPTFRVELEQFRGPLDLLLYLVRRHELDLNQVSLAAVTDQYLAHLEVLTELNVDDVGEFIELASTLVEMKSRSLLPVEPTGDDAPLEDPRDELVTRLLEYKRFRDAASMLEDQGRQWQQRFCRQADDLPPRTVDVSSQPIAEVELWDLVSSFGRMLREKRAEVGTSIVYDDTPIHVYMQNIHERLKREGLVRLSDMFESGMHKSAIIGVFLAILELVRHHAVRAEQGEGHGEIEILPGSQFEEAVPEQLESEFEAPGEE